MPALSLLAAVLLARASSPDSGLAPTPAAPRPAEVSIYGRDTTTVDATFAAWGADLRVEAHAGDQQRPVPVGELRIVKPVDASTARLADRLASGQRMAAVLVTYPGARDTLRVRLVGVTVASQRLLLPAPADGIEAERMALAVTRGQLEADRAEAARRLTEVEALDRRKLASGFELARSQERVRLLDARLELTRRQERLAEERLARAALPSEELSLRAQRVEVLGRAPADATAGGR